MTCADARSLAAPPAGSVYRHFAFFDGPTGQWAGEVAGYVPYPEVAVRASAATRLRVLAAWQGSVIRGLGTRFPIVEDLWRPGMSTPSWDRMVALDVTHIGWPVGDHVYHRFDPIARVLDWPASRVFIEIDVATMTVVAQQRSHRPVRHAVPGQVVVDLTETAWAPYWGWIWGTFDCCGGRWRFRPQIVRRPSGAEDPLRSVPVSARRALEAAPLDLTRIAPALQEKGTL